MISTYWFIHRRQKTIKYLISLFIMLTLLFTIFYLPAESTTTIFRDITNHQFQKQIEKLQKEGIIIGYPDGTFRPDAQISRAETAVLLTKAKKLIEDKTTVNPFKDVPVTHWALNSILAVYKAGFMKGYPDGTFKPEALINRSELSALIGQAKGLKREEARIVVPLAMANDEALIPRWAIGWVTLGYFPEHQYLTYKQGRRSAPRDLAMRGEVVYAVYQLLYPPKKGGIVQVAMNAEPDTLSTWVGIMMAMHTVNFTWAYPPAVGRDENWNPYPGVLKKRPSVEDGTIKIKGVTLEVIYNFREGIRYSDGESADVDDWAYAFMVLQDPLVPTTRSPLDDKVDMTKGKGAYGAKGFDILDSHSIKVYYSELEWRVDLWVPGAWLPGSMALYPKHILEKVYKKMKDTGNSEVFRTDEIMARKPVGYGPYRLTEWKSGSYISLERNPFYIFGKPLLDGVVFRFIPDTTALLARVISGQDVDVAALGLGFDQAIILEERGPKHTKAYYTDGFIFEHLGINMDDSILKDIKVRKALSYAIDREKIINTFFGGKQKAAYTFFHPNHWAYSSPKTKYVFNPEKARQLLEEAGWKIGTGGIRFKDGAKLTLVLETITGDSLREKVQATLASMWKDIGVEIDISKNRPSAAFTTRARRREYSHLIMFAWTLRPTSMGESFFREDYIPSPANNYFGNNWYGYRNKEVTELLTKVSTEMTEEGRKKLLHRMEEVVLDELPVVPLYFRLEVTTAKTNLVNYKPAGISDTPPTWNVSEWYFEK